MISVYYSWYPGGGSQNIPGIISYNHETVLVGGYRSASFAFNANLVTAEEWIFTGIGRHIEIYSRQGNKVWEGIVNEISFNVGPRAIKIGPFMKMSNRINVGYQHPNYGIPGDSNAGTYDETGWADNLSSQRRYGIVEELVSGGTGENPEMVTLRDARLEQQAEPIVSETLSSGQQGQEIAMTISCVGYSRLLEKQIYNLAWQSGWTTVDLSAKIIAMLDENKFFVNQRAINRSIQTTGIDVPPEDSDNRTAWIIMSDHISKSPLSNSLRCGMLEDMTFTLQVLPEETVYSRSSGSNIIKDQYGNTVLNSEVVPGGYMALVDFSIPSSYRVTSVRYDLSGDTVAMNYQEGSLRTVMDDLMLGGIF